MIKLIYFMYKCLILRMKLKQKIYEYTGFLSSSFMIMFIYFFISVRFFYFIELTFNYFGLQNKKETSNKKPKHNE